MLGRSSILLVASLLLVGTATAHAAPKWKGKPAATKAPSAKGKKGKEVTKAKEPQGEPADAEKAAGATAAQEASASKEEGVKPAGTASTKPTDAASVKVKEDKEGVKTYKFETVEVEGRLKSPQVIYFLRRVRAEFDAAALGHRSFLGELSDSRRSAALR